MVLGLKPCHNKFHFVLSEALISNCSLSTNVYVTFYVYHCTTITIVFSLKFVPYLFYFNKHVAVDGPVTVFMHSKKKQTNKRKTTLPPLSFFFQVKVTAKCIKRTNRNTLVNFFNCTSSTQYQHSERKLSSKPSQGHKGNVLIQGFVYLETSLILLIQEIFGVPFKNVWPHAL